MMLSNGFRGEIEKEGERGRDREREEGREGEKEINFPKREQLLYLYYISNSVY